MGPRAGHIENGSPENSQKSWNPSVDGYPSKPSHFTGEQTEKLKWSGLPKGHTTLGKSPNQNPLGFFKCDMMSCVGPFQCAKAPPGFLDSPL